MHERKFPGSGAFQPSPHLILESCGPQRRGGRFPRTLTCRIAVLVRDHHAQFVDGVSRCGMCVARRLGVVQRLRGDVREHEQAASGLFSLRLILGSRRRDVKGAGSHGVVVEESMCRFARDRCEKGRVCCRVFCNASSDCRGPAGAAPRRSAMLRHACSI